MKKVFLLLILFSAIAFSQSIEIKTTLSYSNTVSYEFYIVNTGSANYDVSNHTVDFYTNEIESDIDLAQPNVFSFSYFSCEVNNNVTTPYPTGSYTTITPVTQDGKSANVKFTFVLPSNITPIAPGSYLRFSGNIYENDYSHQFVSSDDWSFLSGSQSVNANVVLRNSGGIVYGNAPRGNTAPTIVPPVTEVVSENSEAGTLVATLNATDAEGDTYTFALGSTGANNTLFEIQNGNQLVTKQPLDYENGNNGQYTYSIIATDQFGASSEDTEFTFGVTDVDPEYEYPEVTGANEDMKVEGISQFSNPKAPEKNVTIINGGDISAKNIIVENLQFESESRAGATNNETLEDIILTENATTLASSDNPGDKYFNNPTTEITNGHMRFIEYKLEGGAGRKAFSSGFTPTKVYTDTANVNYVRAFNMKVEKDFGNGNKFITTSTADSIKVESFEDGSALSRKLSYLSPGAIKISKNDIGETVIDGGTITAKNINVENITGTVNPSNIAIETGEETPDAKIQIGENDGDRIQVDKDNLRLTNIYTYPGNTIHEVISLKNDRIWDNSTGMSGDLQLSVRKEYTTGETFAETRLSAGEITTTGKITAKDIEVPNGNIGTNSDGNALYTKQNIDHALNNLTKHNALQSYEGLIRGNAPGNECGNPLDNKLPFGLHLNSLSWYWDESQNFGKDAIYYHAGSHLFYVQETNASEQEEQLVMEISGNGNVDVKNTLKASIVETDAVKIKDWTIETPDYVFQPDYKLRSLDEVEKHIKEKSHLPEVPSAADMKKDGVDLAEMNMILLKKVEELTLYTIDQEKKNKEQSELIKELVERIEKLEK